MPRGVKTEAEHTEKAKEPIPERGIISPATFRDLLNFIKDVHPRYVVPLVLAGLCGLRVSEVENQKWEDIRLAENRLRVTGAKSGTPSYRIVDIPASAVEWLITCPNRTGRVCKNYAIKRIRKAAKEKGFKLPPNCFRHSFVSYLIAKTKNVAMAAVQAGHTETIAHRHYKELVTKAEGEEWYEILPGGKKSKKILKIS